MSIILVEDRVCPVARPVLQAIADTAAALGHQVLRWRGPFSGKVPHPRRPERCQAAFLWNGVHPKYDPAMAELRGMGARVAYVELGWNPQRGTCQIDPAGINAQASWAGEPLTEFGRTPLPVRSAGDLLVALQLDDDTQIRQLSPWFPHMWSFVEFVCRHSRLPVRLRSHPRAPDDAALRKMAERLGGSWDSSPTFAAAIANCRALATVNSSVGIEAIGQNLPVLCYGLATYRHEGAVYCLDNRPTATERATSELLSGKCRLTEERLQAAFNRVMSNQWTLQQIATRLPPLLERMLDGIPELESEPAIIRLSFASRLTASLQTSFRRRAA